MKRIKSIGVIIGLFVLLSSSCKEPKNAMATEEDKKEKPVNSAKPADKIEVVPGYQNGSTDDFTLLESSISGDNLVLLVQYGGGCETHEWNLKTSGAYAKSLPPQLSVNLEHNSNNDMCRALVRDTLEFNIEKIRYPGSFEVDINIFNFEKRSVRYKY